MALAISQESASREEGTDLCPLQFLKVSFPLSYNITDISRKPSVKKKKIRIKIKAKTCLRHHTAPGSCVISEA